MRPLPATAFAMLLALILPALALAQPRTAARPMAAPRDAAEVFVAAVAARDAAAIAAIYAEDAILLSPNANPVAGRDAIQAVWEQNFATGYSGIRFGQNQRTETGADRAAQLYLWEATITPAGGTAQTIRGRTMLYLTAAPGGGWLISADMWQPIP